MAVFSAIVIAAWRDWFAGKVDRKRRRALRRMLLDRKFALRSIGQLSASVALDEAATRALLVEIGARPDERNPDQWGFDWRIRRAARRKGRLGG